MVSENTSMRDEIVKVVWISLNQSIPDDFQPSAEVFCIIGAVTLYNDLKVCSMVECLKEFGEYVKLCDMRFGDPAYDWSAGGARELAMDYLQEVAEG